MTEFAYSACNKPYNKGEIDQHEIVQHKAARFVTTRQRNRPTVGDILQHLDWGSFEDRCKHARVLATYYNTWTGLVLKTGVNMLELS